MFFFFEGLFIFRIYKQIRLSAKLKSCGATNIHTASEIAYFPNI